MEGLPTEEEPIKEPKVIIVEESATKVSNDSTTNSTEVSEDDIEESVTEDTTGEDSETSKSHRKKSTSKSRKAKSSTDEQSTNGGEVKKRSHRRVKSVSGTKNVENQSITSSPKRSKVTRSATLKGDIPVRKHRRTNSSGSLNRVTRKSDLGISDALRRSRIVQEILDTESSYASSLITLIATLEPLLGSEHPDFPIIEARSIHSTAGIILGYSKLLIEMLTPRVESFDDNTCISDIFLRLADFMKVYTLYIQGYQPFMDKFVGFWQKYHKTLPILSLLSESTQFLTFESCLIVPVQRIPRYQMLIGDIIKHTPKEHPDNESLVSALDKISKVAHHVNDMQKVYEGMSEVVELYKRFGRQLTDDTGVSEFVRSHRRLIKKGDFESLKAGGKSRPVRVYLLNDLFLVSSADDGNKLYKLLCLWLVQFEDINEDTFGFKNEDGELLLELQAKAPVIKDEWTEAIIMTLNNLNTGIIKGSDIEVSKVHVSDAVRWNKALIPPEIAQALIEEQAEKRNNTQFVKLREDREDKDKDKGEKENKSILRRSISGISGIQKRNSKLIGSVPELKHPVFEDKEKPNIVKSADSTPKVPSKGRRATFTNTSNVTPSKGSVISRALISPRKSTTNLKPLKFMGAEEEEPEVSSFAGKLFIRILEARKLKAKNSETKNAYVQIQFLGKQYFTPTAKKTIHPVWKEDNQFIFELGNDKKFTGTHYNLDVCLFNKKKTKILNLGDITIKLDARKLVSRSADKWYSLKKEGVETGEIRIQLHFLSKDDIDSGSQTDIDIFETKVVDDSLTLSEQRLVDYLANMGDSPIPF